MEDFTERSADDRHRFIMALEDNAELADLKPFVPQGARIVGKYDSVVAFGQKRALVIWTRLILPNGNSIVIENLPATDVAGYAGLEDQVDFQPGSCSRAWLWRP